MIVLPVPREPGLLLIGAVRGLVGEVGPVRAAIEGFRPEAIALGLTAEESESLRSHFVGTPTEPVVPLAPGELTEARALARYGEVAVPNPVYLDLLEFGASAGIPVEAVDPDEDVQAEQFVSNIGYVELVRRTLGERRVRRSPPDAPDADAFALQWDAQLNPGRGSARYRLARERAAAEAVRELKGRFHRVAVVVDRERVVSLGASFLLPGGH